ncbi:MAG: orotate phosphoribosyltransferase, partial [Pseudomonadota bacterium]
MTPDTVLDLFREAGALLESDVTGEAYRLSSGRVSSVFLQKALVFSQPEVSAKLCAALAESVTAALGSISVVVGPAMGGVIPGYEL